MIGRAAGSSNYYQLRVSNEDPEKVRVWNTVAEQFVGPEYSPPEGPVVEQILEQGYASLPSVTAVLKLLDGGQAGKSGIGKKSTGMSFWGFGLGHQAVAEALSGALDDELEKLAEDNDWDLEKVQSMVKKVMGVRPVDMLVGGEDFDAYQTVWALQRKLGEAAEEVLDKHSRKRLLSEHGVGNPFSVAEDAKDRGSAVHDLMEYWLEQGAHQCSLEDDVFTHDEVWEPNQKAGDYSKAAFKFTEKEHDRFGEVIAVETPVVELNARYAGTLDCVAEIDGEVTVLDWKSQKDANIYDSAILQISAYALAWNGWTRGDRPPATRGMVVSLGKGGEYNIEVVEDLENWSGHFLSLLELWRDLT